MQHPADAAAEINKQTAAINHHDRGRQRRNSERGPDVHSGLSPLGTDPCVATPNMEYKRCSSCIPGSGALTGYYQPGQLSPAKAE
ncbi:hypothetical protein LAZ67_14002399 [Cordylochernes scorpioides]|uniref:Uncharacterized protein n=1 Tax=Cordylochernes scorpioides TaxID=51811 RepID=A0ABY6L707_9ARAC|nr:hypothetical protein LAZ67_14002399 [Cordylochernes scorpioides]